MPGSEHLAKWATRGTIGLLCAGIVWWSVSKPFNHDELEAVHSAWKILQEELIYVDFFQHHHPLLYVCLAPVIAVGGEHSATVVACRLAMLPFLAGIVAATYLLARQVFGKPAAVLGTIVLLASWPFLTVALEIRPDVPQVMFGMIALVLLFRRAEDFGKAAALRYGLIGICLGLSFLFLQKGVFLMAAVPLLVLWRIRGKEAGWAALAALLAGTAAAVIPFGIWLAGRGMLDDYFFLNWTLNAHFRDHFSFLGNAIVIGETQPVTMALAVAACAGLLSDRRHWELACLAALLCCSIATVRAPYLQYWMPVLPLAAILAGHGLARLFAHRPAAGVILLASCLVMPVLVELCLGEPTNRRQLERIGYVLKMAGPRDAVYDGDATFNVFRNDVDYFWYSVGENQSLGTYRTLREYDYDVYDRIDRMKPKVIGSFQIENLADARIEDHYTRSEAYDDILIRTR